MKKMLKFICLMSMMALLSCQNEEVLNDRELVDLTQLNGDKAVIQQLGFDVRTLLDKGDYYLLEGDIAIAKKNMNGYKKILIDSSSSLKQARANTIVSLSNVSNVKVKIDSNLGSEWRSAILQAMEYYNRAGARIRMSEVSSGQDITVLSDLIGAWGEGTFPSADGKPGATLKLDPQGNTALSLSQKIWLVAHELGHTLGFRHTDYLRYSGEINAPEGAILIPGTPTGNIGNDDPNSVFNSGYYYNFVVQSWSSFSSYDLVAIRYLYPFNDGQVYFKNIQKVISGSTTTVNAVLYVPESVELTMQVGLHIASGTENPEATFNSGTGSSIVVNKNNYNNQTATTKTFIYNKGTYNVSLKLSGINNTSNTEAGVSIINVKTAIGPYITIGSPFTLSAGRISVDL